MDVGFGVSYVRKWQILMIDTRQHRKTHPFDTIPGARGSLDARFDDRMLLTANPTNVKE